MGNDNGNGSPVKPESLDKPRYSYVPPEAEASMVRVLTAGAVKHGAFGWRDGFTKDDYIDKMWRHLNAIRQGEWIDPEYGEPHAAHIAADAHILFDLGAGDGE